MSHAPVATNSLAPPASLSQPLRRLRTRLAVWLWLDGVNVVAWSALGLAAVDFLLDRWFRFDPAQRGVMLLLVVVALFTIAWRRLVRPLLARLSDDALCLEVEAKHRELGQKLITALQLARGRDWIERGISPALAAAVIQAGADAAAAADWSRVLDQHRQRRNAWLVLLATALTACVLGASLVSPLPGIWFRRNVLLAEEMWPQDTYLFVEDLRDGRLRVPRGESLVVRVATDESSRVQPERVALEFRPARGRGSLIMTPLGEGRFEHPLPRVIESFELRASGGDSETDWTPVDVVEPPVLGRLRLEVTPPEYTGRPTAELPAGAGPLAVLEGSRCRLTAVANKPLVAARLVHESGEWPAQIAEGLNTTWTLDETQVRSGRYSIYLEDREGIRPQQPFSFVLQVQPDRAPKVEAKLIGVGGSVLANARVPLAIRVRDDFAVQDVRLVCQSRVESDSAASEPTVVKLPAFAPLVGQPVVAFQDTFDLTPLALTPGRTLTFVVEALDNDRRDGPNVGRSTEFLLRIVTPEELRADWLRREKEQRQELEQVVRTQEELTTDTEALAAAETVTPADRSAIQGLARRQKQVAQQAAAIAQRLEAIAAEVVNNRLDSDPDKLADRLRRELARPLAKTAEESAAEAQQRLEEARRTVDDDGRRAESLRAGAAAEQKTSAELRGILERMLKAEGFQEAVQLLYEIQKAQQDVFDRTQREKQQRIEAILRGTGKKE